MKLHLSRTTAIALALVVLVVASYLIFMRGGEPTNPLTSTQTPDTPQQTIGRELLATLLDLRSLSLDGTLFTDPVFLSLKDFSTPLPIQPAGRRNPFAPLGSDALLSTSTGSSVR